MWHPLRVSAKEIKKLFIAENHLTVTLLGFVCETFWTDFFFFFLHFINKLSDTWEFFVPSCTKLTSLMTFIYLSIDDIYQPRKTRWLVKTEKNWKGGSEVRGALKACSEVSVLMTSCGLVCGYWGVGWRWRRLVVPRKQVTMHVTQRTWT
jgi:hypothetical protein